MTRDDEAGITLVEVIVYMLVTGLFLGLLASLFISGVRAQAQTTERDLATGRASVISDSITSSIRNSSGFVIVSENRALISRTITSGTTSVCRAWLVIREGDADFRRDAADPAYVAGDIIYKESTVPISLTDRLGWSALVERGEAMADGVQGALMRHDGTNPDGTPRLVPVDDDGDGATDIFGRNGSTLNLGMELTLGEATVATANGVTMQAHVATAGEPCW